MAAAGIRPVGGNQAAKRRGKSETASSVSAKRRQQWRDGIII